MPPQLLYDISAIDLNKILYDQEAIRQVNPQRGDMEHLDAIVHVDGDRGQIIGYKDVRDDEFWVAGHIPGRPLLPGVIMIEAAAQVAAFYTTKVVGWEGFIGFGGATDIRFRQPVTPGCRLHLIVLKTEQRHRRITCKVQGLVNGTLVFEASIIGTQLG
jgi:3-hydroxyacyl-[acyl-carrier-protein] dehydratase